MFGVNSSGDNFVVRPKLFRCFSSEIEGADSVDRHAGSQLFPAIVVEMRDNSGVTTTLLFMFFIVNEGSIA